MKAILLVAIGGAVGSVARYQVGALILKRTLDSDFPYGTFTVNVLGCLIAGILAGLGERYSFLTAEMRLLLFTGFLGGFTTFSAFGVETVGLIERGAWTMAITYVALSVLCGVVALWVAFEVSGVATH